MPNRMYVGIKSIEPQSTDERWSHDPRNHRQHLRQANTLGDMLRVVHKAGWGN